MVWQTPDNHPEEKTQVLVKRKGVQAWYIGTWRESVGCNWYLVGFGFIDSFNLEKWAYIED